MSGLYKAQPVEGYRDIIGENESALKYLAFAKLFLRNGEEYHGETGNYETVLVLMSGTVSVFCDGQAWYHIGRRANVFAGKATAVYLPCQSDYRVKAESPEVEIAVCKARAERRSEPFVVYPEDVVVHHRGKETWKREVHDIIADEGDPRVHRIIVGETYNPPGQWSSYPPHKHDRARLPEEAKLEEIYHYQIHPRQGFAVQVHYTEDRSVDNAYVVRHGDTFAIPGGYHPVAAPGGYRVYYLWFLAGETGRTLKPYDDPDHRWLLNDRFAPTGGKQAQSFRGKIPAGDSL